MSNLFALQITPHSDAAVLRLARTLTAVGHPVTGAIQIPADGDMVLQAACGTARWTISQRLGAGAAGCTLDPAALEEAVAWVATRLPDAALLIVNRFGKQEAAGRGFAPLIAAAVDQNTPVLISVAAAHRAAFEAFSDGMAAWITSETLAACYLERA